MVGGRAHRRAAGYGLSGKGIASGMPLGITMTRAEIMDWVPGSHASTFGGNPVCIAAALATLGVIEREHLLGNAAAVGEHMLQRMAEWPKKHKLVGDVRGRGLMLGVEFVKTKKPKSMPPPNVTASSSWPSSAESFFLMRPQHHPHRPAADRHQKRGRRRARCAGRGNHNCRQGRMKPLARVGGGSLTRPNWTQFGGGLCDIHHIKPHVHRLT